MRQSSKVPVALAAAAALTLALGCESYVSGNGVYGVEYRVIPEFHGVRVSDGVQVIATSGVALQPVKVIGDANVIPLIKTELDHDPTVVGTTTISVLHVWVDGRYDPVIAPQVVVSIPSLSYVEAADTSIVTASSTDGDTLYVKLNGEALLDATGYPTVGADVELAGRAIAKLDASGSVTGSVLDHATLVNVGVGPCLATTSANATISCD